MIRDPRNPDPAFMVGSGSTHPFHANLRKTLVLLKIDDMGGASPIYFVVEGLAEWPDTLEEMHEHTRYFYEEHTCPTNFIRIPMISRGGDHDPHGLFDFVDAVWMMDEYEAAQADPNVDDDYLVAVFPQLAASPVPYDR